MIKYIGIYKNNILKWIKTCNNTDYKPLLLLGQTGCGKTLLVKEVLNELNYHIHYFNALNFSLDGFSSSSM